MSCTKLSFGFYKINYKSHNVDVTDTALKYGNDHQWVTFSVFLALKCHIRTL